MIAGSAVVVKELMTEPRLMIRETVVDQAEGHIGIMEIFSDNAKLIIKRKCGMEMKMEDVEKLIIVFRKAEA